MNDFEKFAEGVRSIMRINVDDFYSLNGCATVVRNVMREGYYRNLGTLKEIGDLFGFTPAEAEKYITIGQKRITAQILERQGHKVVIDRVLKTLNVTKRNVWSASRKAEMVNARRICWFILRTHFNWRLSSIARLFNRDHTTIMHGINAYNNDFALQEFVKKHYDEWVHDKKPVSAPKKAAQDNVVCEVLLVEDEQTVQPKPSIDDLSKRWMNRERLKKEINARLMANVDYSLHEYNLPRGV